DHTFLLRPCGLCVFRRLGQRVAQTCFSAMMVLEGVPALDRTCTKLAPGCHWKTKLRALVFWPLGWLATYRSHKAGPWPVSSRTPVCRKAMIFGWWSPTFWTAPAMTWPAEYASATSALMSDAVPPYLAMYSCTITWLSGSERLPYQPFGTMIPLALLMPIARRNAWPWSGPDVAMSMRGLNRSCLNSLMNADTVGTSTEPITTICGFCAATWPPSPPTPPSEVPSSPAPPFL